MNYNRTAWWYDAVAGLVYSGRVWRAQNTFIDQIPAGSRVLIVGGGTGRILERLTGRGISHITYLEKSDRMLLRAGKRNIKELKDVITWLHGDERKVSSKYSYDAVLTFYLFSNFNQSEAGDLWNRLNQFIKPGGRWLYTDFIASVRQNWWQNLLSKAMIGLFRIMAGVSVKKIPDRHLFYKKDIYREVNRSTYFGGCIEALILKKNT